MIKAMGIKIGILLLLLSGTVIEAVPTLTIEPAAPNTDLPFTLTCELASGFISALMNFDKDGTTVYGCASGGVTCNNNDGLADYSEVDWSQTNKGIITISNAAQLRDGGDWTCAVGGGGGTSVAVTVAITDLDCGDPTTPTNGQVSFTTTTYQSTATYSCDSGYTIAGTATTTCQGDGTWSGSVPTCTADTPTPPALTKSCFNQAGCTAGAVLGSIYGTSWLVAIVVNLVIYCMNQMLLAWNLCDGPMKRLWIWILLFIFLPYIPSVISIYLFRTNRPAKKPTSGMELEKNGPKRPLPPINPQKNSDPEKGSPRKLPEPPNPEDGNRLSPLVSNTLSNITETQQANGEQEKTKKKKKKKKRKPKNNQVSDEEMEKSS